MKLLIVTADDFGLDEKINHGIISSHVNGIVTSASLQMNAPATNHAIILAKEHPTLEVGIHLSLVEGFLLADQNSSLRDRKDYFAGPCLWRDWRAFLSRYLYGSIKITDVEAELRAQLEYFSSHFSSVPFANMTQHLHILPGVRDVVLNLAEEFGIKALRATRCNLWDRPPAGAAVSLLGRQFRKRATHRGIFTSSKFIGISDSGQLNEAILAKWLDALTEGDVTEIMTHPGFECKTLREQLPASYTTFDWYSEYLCLIAPHLKSKLAENNIKLTTFRNSNLDYIP